MRLVLPQCVLGQYLPSYHISVIIPFSCRFRQQYCYWAWRCCLFNILRLLTIQFYGCNVSEIGDNPFLSLESKMLVWCAKISCFVPSSLPKSSPLNLTLSLKASNNKNPPNQLFSLWLSFELLLNYFVVKSESRNLVTGQTQTSRWVQLQYWGRELCSKQSFQTQGQAAGSEESQNTSLCIKTCLTVSNAMHCIAQTNNTNHLVTCVRTSQCVEIQGCQGERPFVSPCQALVLSSNRSWLAWLELSAVLTVCRQTPRPLAPL